MGIVLAEVGVLILAILVHIFIEVTEGNSCEEMFECLRPRRDNYAYERLDAPPVNDEPQSFKTELKTFLKHYMIFN